MSVQDRISKAVDWATENRHNIEISDEDFNIMMMLHFTKSLNADRPKELIDLDVDTYSSILDFIKQGKKIEAVKTLKLATGMGLKEAKDMIDNTLTPIAVRSITASI